MHKYLPVVKTTGKILLCLILAMALAGGVTWLTLRSRGDGIHNGPWMTGLSVGSEHAGVYERARMAVFGIWALRSSETIYFTALTDSAGKQLSHSCSYRIEGTDPDTRWWSITPYEGAGLRLIGNPIHRYSVSKTTVARRADGSWIVRLSRREQPENWLPLAQTDSRLTLALRCYNPTDAFRASLATVHLPRIISEGCQ